MEQEFLNLFIENMSKKIEELTRKEIFNLTQITLLERKINELQEQNVVFQKGIDKFNTKESRKQLKKEVDTSSDPTAVF